MAELNYKKFESYLSGLSPESFSDVYLIHGEEYLIKSAFTRLLDVLVPSSKRSLGYEPVDEDTESMADLIERLNTFSLMPGTKVVSLCDSKIFHSKQDLSALLKKCKTAEDKGDRKKAVRTLNLLLSLAGVEIEDAKTGKGKDELKYQETFQDDGAWFNGLLDYLSENPVSSKNDGDPSKMLKDAIEKGFPPKHHLIITSEIVDKRKVLYTAIKDKGTIIDCSVPKGERKADKDGQVQVLKENIEPLLKKSGKTINPDAFRYMIDITGFDLRTFMGNLEKLIVFSGSRKNITADDARSLLKRTKQDPIYELSGSISERSLENALFYTGSLLANEAVPLQILAAIVNQLRRLILAKDFLVSLPPGKWRPSLDYNGFRASVMPLVKIHDEDVSGRASKRDNALNPSSKDGQKNKKAKTATDLILAKNPNSPYPVFLLCKNAGRYSMEELIRAYEFACKADVRLKSSGENPRLVLDDLIIKICSSTEK